MLLIGSPHGGNLLRYRFSWVWTWLYGLAAVGPGIARAQDPLTLERPYPVCVVRCSHDGKTLCDAGGRPDALGTATLSDVATGKTRATLTGHRGRVLSLAFAKDGAAVATGSLDGTVRTWDARTDGLKGSFPHQLSLRPQVHLAEKVDGFVSATLAVPLGRPETELDAGEYLPHLVLTFPAPGEKGVESTATVVMISGAGLDLWKAKKIWFGCAAVFKPADRGDIALLLNAVAEPVGVHVWVIRDDDKFLHRLGVLKCDPGPMPLRAFAPDNRTLATTTSQHDILIWDTLTKEQVARFTGHKTPVTALTFSADGSMLATGSKDGLVKVWDLPGRK